jgi:uncharacterized protein
LPSDPPDQETVATTEHFGPVKPQERVKLLDVLRGFAIFGMLLANNNAGAYTEFLLPSALDRFTVNLVEILVRDKFWPLFALLFGVGFTIQLDRAGARNVSILIPYLRRLLFLALIGCVLGLFINVPQLLHLAIAGVPMLFIGYALRRRPHSWLLAAALAVCVVSLSVYIPRDVARARGLSGLSAVTEEEAAVRIEQFRDRDERYEARDVSWSLDRFGPHARAALRSYVSLPVDVARARGLHHYLLLYMLVGILLWRTGVLQEASRHRRLFTCVLAVSLPVGVGAAIFVNAVQHAATLTRFGLAAYPSHLSILILAPSRLLASLGMMLAYIAGIALLMQRSIWAQVLNVLSPIGRTALTNYAVQALWPAVLFGFYTPGVPLGSMGSLERITVLISLFGLQVVFSRAWLRSYRFGPLEWLWRSLTYWQLQPMRRTGAA